MHHVLFAKFENARDAEGAIADLHHADEERNHCSETAYVEHLATGSGTKPQPEMTFCDAVVHRDITSAGELHLGESASRRGVTTGILVGGIGGALVAAIVTLVMIPGAVVGAALLGGLLGAGYGAFMGGVCAASCPDPTLAKLTRDLHEKQVVVTVETPDTTTESEAEAIIGRHGGNAEHRQIV